MQYYFLSFEVKHSTNNHYTLVIENEDSETFTAVTSDQSLIDRLESCDPTAEDDAILLVKIENGLI